MIVDYPSPACKESQVLQLVHGSVHELPIVFLTSGMGTESIAALTAEGSFEYVEQGRLAQLPMAVRRVLNQRKLRSELADAKKALRHSQSLYRALADNPTYGIYRCDADGELLDGTLLYAADRALYEMKELSTGTADAPRNFQQLLPDAAPGVLPTTE
jgi:PAS domain-containing protein